MREKNKGIEMINKEFTYQKFKNRFYYINFSKAIEDENWKKILSTKKKITTLNVVISSWQKILKFLYVNDCSEKYI